jgi:hypothetical protein
VRPRIMDGWQTRKQAAGLGHEPVCIGVADLCS